MALETLYADALLTPGLPAGGANALGPGTGSWTTDTGNTSWIGRFSMENPTDPATPGATHTVTVRVRKDSVGQAGSPDVSVNLYSNGTLVKNIVAQTSVTTAGQDLVGTFATADVPTLDTVEIEVGATAAGGNPSNRSTAQIDYIRLEANTSPAAPPVDTMDHVSLDTPPHPLVDGAGLQTFRAHVYLEGAGAPTGEIFLYENGTLVRSVWSGTVTGTEASPATVTGSWNATEITDPAAVEARFEGTGVAGGTARLHSIEWEARVDDSGGGGEPSVLNRSASSNASTFESSASRIATTDPSTPGTIVWRRTGAVYHDGFRASAKVTDTTTARLVVSTDPGLANPVYSADVAPNAGGVVKAQITGLALDTQYYYGWETNRSGVVGAGGEARTAPAAPGNPASFRWAVSGCSDDPTNAPIFAQIPAENPRPLFYQLQGDHHYRDINEDTIVPYRTAFDEVLTLYPNQQELYSKVPFNFVWSDHDWAGNGATRDWVRVTGGGGTGVPNVGKAHLWNVYREYFPHYDLESGDGEGVQQKWQHGRVRFYMLDVKSYADFPTDPNTGAVLNDPNETKIGAAQKAWINAELAAHPDDPKFVFISEPWYDDTGGQTANQIEKDDAWPGYQEERDAMIAQWEADGVRNVVLVAGDMHASAFDDGTNAPGGGTVVKAVIQAAALDSKISNKGGPYSHGPYPVDTGQASTDPATRMYTIVDVDDQGTDTITATVTAKSEDGQTRLQNTITFDNVGGVTGTAHVRTASSNADTFSGASGRAAARVRTAESDASTFVGDPWTVVARERTATADAETFTSATTRSATLDRTAETRAPPEGFTGASSREVVGAAERSATSDASTFTGGAARDTTLERTAASDASTFTGESNVGAVSVDIRTASSDASTLTGEATRETALHRGAGSNAATFESVSHRETAGEVRRNASADASTFTAGATRTSERNATADADASTLTGEATREVASERTAVSNTTQQFGSSSSREAQNVVARSAESDAATFEGSASREPLVYVRSASSTATTFTARVRSELPPKPPARRRYTVAAEDRTATVAKDPRRAVIPARDNVRTVKPDKRTYRVKKENRSRRA